MVNYFTNVEMRTDMHEYENVIYYIYINEIDNVAMSMC